MNSLSDAFQHLVSSPTLVFAINVAIQVTVLALLAKVFAIGLRRHAALRYALLLGFLVLMLFVPLLSATMQRTGLGLSLHVFGASEAANLSKRPNTANQVGLRTEDVRATHREKQRIATLPELDDAAGPGRPIQPTSPKWQIARASMNSARLGNSQSKSSSSFLSSNWNLQWTLAALARIMVLAWLSGVFIQTVRLAIVHCRLRRDLHRCRECTEPSVLLAAQYAISNVDAKLKGKQVKVLISPHLPNNELLGPFATGWLRPAIVLPQSLVDSAGSDELQNVLIHEYAHVARRDSIVVWLQHIASILYWPHPFIRRFHQDLARAREEVCDNYVLGRNGPQQYCRSLLELACALPVNSSMTVGSPGLFAQRWKLEDRVRDLLDTQRNRECSVSKLGVAFCSFVLACCVFLSATICVQPLAMAKPQEDAVGKSQKPKLVAKNPNLDPEVFLNSDNPKLDAIGDPLPERAIMRLGTERFRHPSSVRTLRISPDESQVVSMGGGYFIGWDAKTGKELWRNSTRNRIGHISGHHYGQRLFDFGKTSNAFYSVGKDNEVLRWTLNALEPKSIKLAQTFDLAATLRNGRRGVTYRSIDINNEETFALMGGQFGVGLFRLEDGKRMWFNFNRPKEIGDPFAGNDRLAFGGEHGTAIYSPDEKTVASVLSQAYETIVILDAETGKEKSKIETKSRIVRLCFSPDGKSIFTTHYDCGVRKYSLETSELEWELPLQPDPKGAESYTCAIACSNDGKRVAACAPIGPKYWIYLLDAETGEEISILKSGWKPWAVDFTDDNQELYSSGWDATIRRWQVETAKEIPIPEGLRASSLVDISADGYWLAIGTQGTVRIVDRDSGKEVQRIAPIEMDAESITFSPDSQSLYIGGNHEDKVTVQGWNIRTGERTHHWSWPEGGDSLSGIEEVRLSPDGKILAAASFRQDAVYVWDTETKKQISQLTHQNVYGLSFSPDGRTLATAGWDKRIRIWDWSKGTTVGSQFIDDRKISDDPRMYTVCHSPNGKHLAVAHLDGQTSIWNCEDPSKLQLLRVADSNNHRFTFGALEYSPDGLWIAAGRSNGKVDLFNAYTGKRMLELREHSDHVYTVRFGKDSRTLASGGGGLTYIWDLSASKSAGIEDFDALWKNLSAIQLANENANSNANNSTFEAMQTLAQIDGVENTLFQRISNVETVLDPQAVIKDISSSDAAVERRLVLLKKTTDENPNVELLGTLRHALTVLRMVNTPSALEHLEWLASHHPNDRVQDYARLMLN